MGQMGFHDLDKRLDAISAKGDPLEVINATIPFQGRQHDALASAGPCRANGFIVLTTEGIKAAESPLDLETIRIRSMLRQEMLHPELRDKPFKDFANGHPTSAIQEAYKIVEIDVKAASGLQHIASGVNLVLEAFKAANGPLTDPAENDSMRNALPRLFAGAMGRFRNPSTHTHRSFPDLFEAMEELMLASRLLRFLDEPARR